jgi:hypothetical protein
MADAIAAGEASMGMAKDEIEYRLRGVVIDGMRQQLQKMTPRASYPPPPV